MPPFRRHRRAHARTSNQLPPAAWIGICLAAAILLTVIVGNLLKIWLDDETFHRLTEGEETAPPQEDDDPLSVRRVNAYPFSFGDPLESLVGQTSLSLSLNTPTGELLYSSAVASYLGLPSLKEADLVSSVGELSGYIPYISGVFYPQAFLQGSSDLRHAVAGSEISLLREFLHAGGNEILLCGVPVTHDRIEETVDYVKGLKAVAGNTPVGVAIPYSVASRSDNWELLAMLSEVCDFCVLDLRAEVVDDADMTDSGISPSASQLLADCGYFTSVYQMRLLFSESQTALISTAITQMQPNFQVVSLPPLSIGEST